MDGSFLTADSVTLELIWSSLHTSAAPRPLELIAATQSMLVFVPAVPLHVSEASQNLVILRIQLLHSWCDLAPSGGQNKPCWSRKGVTVQYTDNRLLLNEHLILKQKFFFGQISLYILNGINTGSNTRIYTTQNL